MCLLKFLSVILHINGLKQSVRSEKCFLLEASEVLEAGTLIAPLSSHYLEGYEICILASSHSCQNVQRALMSEGPAEWDMADKTIRH